MISVILPVYNVECYIADCINSLLKQTYNDFEVIIVDDGSPDSSAQIAEEILSKSSIPYKIIHTENRGVSAARNTGVLNAEGEYVVMVDSDDTVSPEFLSDFMGMTQKNTNSNIFSCSFKVVSANPDELCKIKGDICSFTAEQAQQLFMSRSVKFLLPALMLKKSFLTENELWLDEDVRYSEDVQFIWKCLAHNEQNVVHTSKQNYIYILHEGSTMTASGIKKILTGCSGMNRLYKEIESKLCEAVRTEIVERWYFAMLHGAAKMLKFKDFKTLYNESKAYKYMCKLAGFNGLKTKIIALVFKFSKKTGYYLMRKF